MRPILKFERKSSGRGLLGACIADAIEDLKAHVQAKRLKVRLNLDSGFGGAWSSSELTSSIGAAIKNAVDRSPLGGEVSLIGVLVGGQLQLEIADDGSWNENQRNCAFASSETNISGLRRSEAKCPQGGQSVSLIWDTRAQQRMVA